MRNLIKLGFFMWLAIAAGVAWITDDQVVAGQISKAVLCALGFFGGMAGLFVVIHQVALEDEQ